YYDATIGRFISADTFVQSLTGLNFVSTPLTVNAITKGLRASQASYPMTIPPAPINPQALNRYSYAINNPLRYVDPTGEQWVETVLIVSAFLAIVAMLDDIYEGEWPWSKVPTEPEPTPPTPEPTSPTPESDFSLEGPSYVSDRVTAPDPSELVPDIDNEWWKPDPQPELHQRPKSDSTTSSNTGQESDSDTDRDRVDDTYDDYYWDYYWGEWYW
ncbi:hypothetical protein ACFLWC_07870, partial [Chloroflexota bacterium]